MSPNELSRILQMVDHYGIPLSRAKRFAKYNDWKKRAGVWQRTHDPVKPTSIYSSKMPKKKYSSKMPLQTLVRLIWFGEEE